MLNVYHELGMLVVRHAAGTDPSPVKVETLFTDTTRASSAAPGQDALGTLVSTIRTWSLVACVLAIIIAAVLWAWGAQSQNAAQATQGKKGVIVAVAAAALIFAAEGLVNFGITFGSQIH